MYAIILVICLLSVSGQCQSFVEDPEKYYETTEECQEKMIELSAVVIKYLEDSKEQGQLSGKCVHVPGIKST